MRNSYQAKQDAQNWKIAIFTVIFILLVVIGGIIYFSEALFALFIPVTFIVFLIFLGLLFLRTMDYDVDGLLKWVFVILVICCIVLVVSNAIAFQFGTTHFGQVAKDTFDVTFDQNKSLIGVLT
jgi:hypothetical protein